MTTSQGNMDGPQLPSVDIDMADGLEGSRPISPPGRAAEFLNVHGAAIHPIFATDGSNASHTASELAAWTLSQSTRQHAEQFLQIMDEHQATSNNDVLRSVDLRAKTSWDEVLEAARKAEIAYQAARRKPLRKAGRWVSQYSGAVVPFLRLIPSDGYCSTLYGGLRLVFEAASQVDERRAKVLKSFLRIPNIILLAESCVANFPSDQLLYQKAEDVFLTALPAIEGMTSWLKQSPGVKQFRAVLLGPKYNKSFREKLTNLDEALKELHERASVLRDESICKTEVAVASVRQVVNHTDTQMSAVIDDLKSSAKAQKETQSMMNDIHDLEEIRKETKRAMSMVLEQTIKTSQWMEEKDRAIRRLKDQLEVLEKTGAALTRDDLLDLLNVRAEVIREEFGHLQRACNSLEVSSGQTALSILKSQRLQEWLSKDAGTLLFIEAGPSSSSSGRITSLSVLSTEVIDHLRDKEPAVAIYFFCGQHSSPHDPTRGPVGMMRSLISQILRLYPVELDFVSRRVSRQLEVFNLHTLCDCFLKLIKRLPHSLVLVCIIDGISFFETKEWESDCQYIMLELRELLNDDQIPPVVKLLITSPARSRSIAGNFPSQFRWTLPESGANRHGPTSRDIDLARSRQMRPNQRHPTVPMTISKQRRRIMRPRHEEQDISESSSDSWLSEMSLGEEDMEEARHEGVTRLISD